MPAIIVTTIAATKKIAGGENVEAVFQIIVFTFG
jgi:hypothetical protein